jgi:acyl-CoA thioester hydrolase
MTGFNWQVRIYYNDTDAGGVVYHANYLKFMEQARTEWLRSLGYSQRELKKELSLLFTVSQIDIKYRAPARMDELLTVNSETTRIGGASIHFRQQITNELDHMVCEADITVACIDANTFKPKRLPAQLKPELYNGN